ncbi:MAG: hypothetical protein ACLQLG_18100 [Thermoguttaceae bacterium]
MPEQPFALFISWTCYGTWLPGDRRGHVSNTLRSDAGAIRKRNTPGDSFTADDDLTHQIARSLQKSSTVCLAPQQALVVAAELVAAAGKRAWRIMRAAVMWNHAHVVITAGRKRGHY